MPPGCPWDFQIRFFFLWRFFEGIRSELSFSSPLPLVISITPYQLLHMVYVCYVVEVRLYSAPNRNQNTVTEHSTACSRSRCLAPVSHSAHEHSYAFSADFINRSVKRRVCCFSSVASPSNIGPVRVVIFQLYTDRLYS